jgi:hypothetical protein
VDYYIDRRSGALSMNKREAGQQNTGLFARGENILNSQNIKYVLPRLVCHAKFIIINPPPWSAHVLTDVLTGGAFDLT